MVKLEDVVRAVSGMCPEVLVSQENDGNIILSLNMTLVDDKYLMPFSDPEGDDIE
jgi:hypothetical protein